MGTEQSRRRRTGVAVGVSGIVVITALCVWAGPDLPTSVPALLLLVPVIVAGLLGGTRVAVPISLIAGFAYSLTFLPPVGTVRFGFTNDVYMIVTFLAVGMTVGVLSSRSAQGSGALLDEQRAMLLRGVSHDLRTPLTTIRSVSTDLLEGAGYDDGTRSALLGMVVDESNRLDRIVGNLLSISRIQAGALAPALAPEPLRPLVAASVRRLDRHRLVPGAGDVAPADRARVEVVIDDGVADVIVDAVQFDQVVTNLLENALRVAPAASVVTVSAGDGPPGFVTVSVADEGPGFDPAVLAHVFELPHQGASATNGLGLVVCRAIVEAHGGSIRATNRAAGGAEVAFTVRAVR